MDNQGDIGKLASEVAEDHIKNLIYTILSDFAENLIEGRHITQQVALDAASATLQKYAEKEIRVRKRPVKKSVAGKKGKEKGSTSLVETPVTWIHHPGDPNYSYSFQVNLWSGWAVRDNATGRIVGVVTQKSTMALDDKDRAYAKTLGYMTD